MNTRLYTLYALIALHILAGCGPRKPAPITKHEVMIYRPTMPAPHAVVGAWFGKTLDDLYYYRLVLRENGGGTLIYSFAQDEAHALAVTDWNLQDRNITVKVDASRSVLKPISIRGTAGINYLRLTIIGSGWEQAVRFTKEEDFEHRYFRLKMAEE